MALLEPGERSFLQALSDLSHCNPFLPERLELEREVLGGEYDDAHGVWSKHDDHRINVERLRGRVEPLVNALRERIIGGARVDDDELVLYEDLALYFLYDDLRGDLEGTIDATLAHEQRSPRVAYWKSYLGQFEHYLKIPGRQLPSDHDPAHLLAGFFQIRRAFHHIYHFILGRSMPAVRLRAAVWQSIFTHDLRRFRRTLYDRMGDVTTLIGGPSGTGKELVARAIGFSRYIPFDVETQKFSEGFASSFHALNISALSPTLVESELFGHCRGAFTGAVNDREGWLEVCRQRGTVFLDEIGDLDAEIQVKLLRVLQTRSFQRLGESAERTFQGKIIAATNRNLAEEMHEGRFREDFYYRLCSDIVTTPSLREQLADSPDDLGSLVEFIAKKVAGEEAGELADEVAEWINSNLGRDYAWPGNIRELEQCVRNIMIRKQYQPRPAAAANRSTVADQLAEELAATALTADELLRRYCTMAYAKLGSYEQAARQLKLDRRTVRSKVDQELLEQLKQQMGSDPIV